MPVNEEAAKEPQVTVAVIPHFKAFYDLVLNRLAKLRNCFVSCNKRRLRKSKNKMMKRLAFRAVARLQNKTRQVSSAKGVSHCGGLGECPTPPENFEIWRLRNALVSIFGGIFIQKNQSWQL